MTDDAIVRAYEDICRRWSALDGVEREGYLDALAIPVTYNSTKIENDRIDIHDTRAILGDGSVVNYTGELRDLYEIDNHGRAWEKICEMSRGEFAGIDVKDLLQLHFIVTEHTYDAQRWMQGERPGTFKVHDYGVGMDQGVGLPPEECQFAVEDLLVDVNGQLERCHEAEKALVCASYLHAKLSDIHPFADGNGRTARLAQNLYLIALGHPPIVQRAEDKMAYFGALDLFHREGDLSGMVEFNRVETCLTWGDAGLG